MKLVIAATYSQGCREKAEMLLKETFGEIEDSAGPFELPHENSHALEMGVGLAKSFFSFSGFVPRNALIMAKLKCVSIEGEQLDPGGNRQVNFDPMLVSVENVVMATSKNLSHRVYLTSGVYGELELVRKKTGFEKTPWANDEYVANIVFFERVSNAAKGIPKS